MTVRGYIKRRGRKLQAVIVLGGGRKVRRSTGCVVGQEAEAEAILNAALTEIGAASAATVVGAGPTVREWCTRWIAGRSHKTSSSEEEQVLRDHLYPFLGHVPLARLTKSQMLDWVKSLPARISARTGEPLAPRTVHHIAETTKRCLGEAVDRELIASNPCAWRARRDLPAKRDVNATRREDAAFSAGEAARLIFAPEIPLFRRVMYAGLILDGPRPGEVVVRRFRDLDQTWSPLPLLRTFSAWNTKHHLEGPTKTGAKKYLPVHPIWHALLREWIDHGWMHHVGRAPRPDDYLFPEKGKPMSGSNLNRWFKDDLERLGLPGGRTLSACRSTFISLADVGGATREEIKLITHPAPVEAFDFYPRLRIVWPKRCSIVRAVVLPCPPGWQVTEQVTVGGTENENACNAETLQAFRGVGAAGFEPATPAV